MPQQYLLLSSATSTRERRRRGFLLLLSDFQVGIKTTTYNFDVFKKRMANLKQRLLKVVALHRRSHPVNKLLVFLMGDLVHNENTLRFLNLEELAGVVREQMFEVCIPELQTFFMEMLRHFKKVEVVCVHGNHGEMGRIYAKTTNLDDIIYHFLKVSFRENPRINFKLTTNFYQVHQEWDWRFLVTHGDKIPMHLTLPWYGLTTRLMRWQGSIGDFDYLCLGHFHIASMLDWNGKTIFTNGTFSSDDEWALQRLGLSSSVCQLLLGIHEHRGISFIRKIWLE